jgi:hypothetical protein
MEGSENFGAPKSLASRDLGLDVPGERIERIEGSHFVQAVLDEARTNARNRDGGKLLLIQ